MKSRRVRRKPEKITEIKKCLLTKGVRQSDIARKIGVSPSAVNQVITGIRDTEKIREALIAAGVSEKWLVTTYAAQGSDYGNREIRRAAL